jgi:PAS domain S-box-containing protein
MEAKQKINILLVDDHLNNLLVLEAVLESLEQNLVKAQSGDEALECLLKQDFGLILLDVQMPGMDGFETAAMIRRRERSRYTPIIFLTAIDKGSVSTLKGYSLGSVDYMFKPIVPEILRSKVSLIVNLQRKTEEVKRLTEQLRMLERTERESARSQTMEVLNESEERFRSIFMWAPAGMALVDRSGLIIESNIALQKMLGYNTLELHNIPFTKITHPEDAAADMVLYKELLRGERDHYQIENRYIKKDGCQVWGSMTVSLDQSTKSDSKFAIAVIEEITDRKQSDEERSRLLDHEREARAEAEAANQAKDEFLAIVSHELRTPLTPLIGWIELLSGEKLDEETYAQALEGIERSAKSQAQIVDDLLDVSRIIIGKLNLDLHEICSEELTLVVATAIDAQRPTAEAKGIKLQSTFSEELGCIKGDPDRLQQVVWNLLSNSIKFTPSGGLIEIFLERMGTYVEITVSDTGNGISPEFLPFVFDRFRQADSKITRSHGGLGLGLAIVRYLVEMHGGEIYAYSRGVGFGATFIVKLPVVDSVSDQDGKSTYELHRSSDQSNSLRNKETRLDGLRVLIVDDEQDTLDMVKIMLEHFGAKVITAASTGDALATLKDERPDVLLSDIGMPGEDGFSLISKVRALKPDQGGSIPAAAFTAYARDEDRINTLSAGFQMHISKPIEPAELVRIIAKLAGRA